jgi:hypothetical protein
MIIIIIPTHKKYTKRIPFCVPLCTISYLQTFKRRNFPSITCLSLCKFMICAINRFDYLYTTKLSGFGTKKKIEFVCEIKFKIRGLNVITSQIFCTTFYAYSLPTAFIFILSLGYGFFFFAKKLITFLNLFICTYDFSAYLSRTIIFANDFNCLDQGTVL